MTDVEIVARVIFESDGRDWAEVGTALPWYLAAATAALAAATPLIEARLREECIAAVRSVPHGTGYGVANCEAAIRKGTSNE